MGYSHTKRKGSQLAEDQVSIKKHGGIYFARIWRIRVSFCIKQGA